jgi:hypothetical protein
MAESSVVAFICFYGSFLFLRLFAVVGRVYGTIA